jgi:hypothetical protein
MGRRNFENLVLNVRLDRKQRAFQQALLVPWRQLEAGANEYVQWHSFVLWVRTISDCAGELPGLVRCELCERCPGFLEKDEAGDVRPVWKSLEEWIAAQHFRQVKAAGWFDAMMYYAYRDLRVEQGWTLSERTKTAWRQQLPPRWPTFEEWIAEITATPALEQEGTEKSRAVTAMANVNRERLTTAVSDAIERRALTLWVDCISTPLQPLDTEVLAEVQNRCPGLVSILSGESVWRTSLVIRLIRHGESQWRATARAEGWYAALRYHVAHHPRYQRLIHYRERCHDEWLRIHAISSPSFPAWLAAADAYCLGSSE